MRNLLCAENPNLAPRITQIWAAIRNTCATGCILPFIRQLNSSFKTYQAFFSSLISQYFLPLSLLACQSSDCVLALKGGARRRRPHLLREYSISEKHACCWPLWFIACYEWPRPAAVLQVGGRDSTWFLGNVCLNRCLWSLLCIPNLLFLNLFCHV